MSVFVLSLHSLNQILRMLTGCFAKPSKIFIPPVIQKSILAGVVTTFSIDTTYTLEYSTSATVVVQETYPSTTTVTSTSTSFHTITLSPGAAIPTLGT